MHSQLDQSKCLPTLKQLTPHIHCDTDSGVVPENGGNWNEK